MEDSRNDVKWSPRVPRGKLRKLYESVSLGIWDEELIDDVGMTLYMRCRDIITIHQARAEGKVTCPRCQRLGTTTLILRPTDTDAPMTCPVCRWSMTWPEYHRTFQRRQLNPGGATDYFRKFMEDYARARGPKAKMLAIDQVIHAFHYSFRDMPEQATRAAGVNLITGKLGDVVTFLDELSGMDLPRAFRDNHRTWRKEQDSIRWDEIFEKRKEMKETR